MKSVNQALKKIYKTAFTGISYNSNTVRSFFQQAPDNLEDQYYIVYGSINSNDISTQIKAATETSMQVTIHTFEQKYNDGQAADAIAEEIFSRLYPNKQDVPDMGADGFQLVNTRLTQDRELPYNMVNNRNYLDRILVFSHSIYHHG